jgi:hypothetical protein
MHRLLGRSNAIICGTALLLNFYFVSAVCADEPSSRALYIGILAGQSKFNNSRYLDRSGNSVNTTATREWTDQSSNSLSAVVGFWINPYFAVEASYWDFGEGQFNEERATNLTPFGSGTRRDRFVGSIVTAKGYAGGIVGSFPWRSFRVSAKVSALKNEVTSSGAGVRTTTMTFPLGQPPVLSTVEMAESYKNTTALYGASLSYTWLNHYVVEFDWRNARHLGDQRYFDGLNVSAVGLGIAYRF